MHMLMVYCTDICYATMRMEILYAFSYVLVNFMERKHEQKNIYPIGSFMLGVFYLMPCTVHMLLNFDRMFPSLVNDLSIQFIIIIRFEYISHLNFYLL